jgi:hypothetical protein
LSERPPKGAGHLISASRQSCGAEPRSRDDPGHRPAPPHFTRRSARRSTSCANIPLDIPVDELVTWKQLTGDRRLSDTLAGCDERGWDALPLAPRELSRLFPSLWGSVKAVERWLAKNPPKAHRDTIRVWGVLAEYRGGARHRRWSKALVRHGADVRAALAEVLAVPAGDIRVRGGAKENLTGVKPRGLAAP